MKGITAVGTGTVTGPGDLEMALGNARDQREDMVLWLALQVMMTDDVALADDALQDRLIVLQDRIEDIMRDRLGLPDRDAPLGASVSAGCQATGPDREDGLSSEAQDFITRTVDKVVEGIAARLDALSEQLAAIHRAQARGTARPGTGHPAGEGEEES
jgi:hypothetical protein